MISIITPTLNAARVLPDCLASAVGQLNPITHLVQDGGSVDNTAALASAAGAEVDSARDSGIYDAMNRGITRARTDIVGLLNADDFYASADVTQRIEQCFADTGSDVVFGDLVYVRDESCDDERPTSGRVTRFRIVRHWKGWDGAAGTLAPERVLRAFRWGWMPPHPTLFVRREVYERCGMFRLDHGTAADYELMLRLLVKAAISVAYIPHVLVCMRTGGASNVTLRARVQANYMDRRAWRTNALQPWPWTGIAKPLRKLPQWLPTGAPPWRVGSYVEPWW